MSVFKIGQLSTDDWKRLRAIRLNALRNAPRAFSSTLQDEQAFLDQQWIDRLTRTDVASFIASMTNEELDVGLAVGGPYDNHAGLFSLWVQPDARRSGIADALVDRVIDWARVEKYSKLLLDVSVDNQPAIQLYLKRGFALTGETSQHKQGDDIVHEQQMVLTL